MTRARLATLALVGALLSTGSACFHSGTPFDQADPQAHSVGVVVKNNNFYDMDVYAVGDGVASRIGSVSGLSSARFSVDESFFSASDVRIVATPIGGNGRASTGPLNVRPGETIYFNVNTNLRTSTMSIH
jgi:hypothetical protein